MNIQDRYFGTTSEGQEIKCWKISAGDYEANILDYGATIQSLIVPSKDGMPIDVVLGYDDIQGYEAGTSCHGAVIGRFANRIKGSSFTLDGISYALPKNQGENHLHGTSHKSVFSVEALADCLKLTWKSPHGEDGFPGNFELTVKYMLSDDGVFSISYEAKTDAPTVVNITNHAYFNLAGTGDITDHLLQLDASAYTEKDSDACPTGRILSVQGTALDFRSSKMLGAELTKLSPELVASNGFDHNLIFDNPSPPYNRGSLYCPRSGVKMHMSTTQPAVQIYTGNHLEHNGALSGKNNTRYTNYSGVCLETQHFPDSPNNPHFPSTALYPGETFKEVTEFKFTLE